MKGLLMYKLPTNEALCKDRTLLNRRNPKGDC